MTPPRWVFLDRDGTLNVPAAPHEYITEVQALALLPGAGEAVARLNRAGCWVGVVTNQRGVARGQLTPERLEAIHLRLRELLDAYGAHLDGIWVCPHDDGRCTCRKPLPGLLYQARDETPGLELSDSAMVGDAKSDVAAGRAAGAFTVRLNPAGEGGGADAVVPDLTGAAELLLNR